MRLGFHLSIAGGFLQAAERALALGCETVQVFSRSPRMWRAQLIEPEDALAFRSRLAERSIAPVFVHTPYLLNLGSADRALADKSARVLAEELQRAEALGAGFVVTHLGGAPGPTDRVLKRIARRLEAALRHSPESVVLLLENSGGAGNLVGASFDELAAILECCCSRERLGVCLDTAHAFAAGYEMRTPEGLEETLADFHRSVGLDLLRLIHANDSKGPLGSHLDRHWHIGRGEIGLAGFRNILRHPKLQALPMIMETPKDAPDADRRNMRIMKRLRKECSGEGSGNRPRP